MPILWSYLFRQYTKVLLLSASAFIVVLMTLRLGDIAKFASFGASAVFVLQFALNQMIFILPYALPVSCFLSSILLVQRLSSSRELTALRSFGLSFYNVFFPILLASSLIAAANFIIVSEVASFATHSNNQLKEKIKAINPLLLIQNKQLLDAKGLHFFSLAPSNSGDSIRHAVLALSNRENTKIQLLLAKKLACDGDQLISEHSTVITNLGNESGFDRLIVENIAKTLTPSLAISGLMQTNSQTEPLRPDRMPLKSLIKHISSDKASLIYSEITRRVSSGLSILTFTFMGLAFGITISRRPTRVKLAIAIVLLAIYLVTHLMAKEVRHHFIYSLCFYFIPHLLILSLSFWTVNRMTKGIET